MTDQHILTIGYGDRGVVMQTQSGATVVLPADDALDIASALTQAAVQFTAHRQRIAAIKEIGRSRAAADGVSGVCRSSAYGSGGRGLRGS